MKANSKISAIEYIYSYFNRCLVPLSFFAALVITLTQLFLNQNFIDLLIYQAGLFFLTTLLYKLLNACRRQILELGNNRFDLFAVLIYVSLIACNFISTKSISINYIVLNKIVTFHSIQYLTLALALAVIWYIFSFELDKKDRRIADYKAMKIDNHVLIRNYIMVTVFADVIVIGVMYFYNVYLSLISIAAIVVARILASRHLYKLQIVFYVVAILACVLLTSTWQSNVLIYPTVFMHIFEQHGIIKSTVAIFKNYPLLFNALPILIPFLFINLIRCLTFNKELRHLANEVKLKAKLEMSGEILIGTNVKSGKQAFLSDDELNTHALFLGTTGGGKTTAIMNVINHCAKNEIPCIMIDGKGSPDLPEKIKKLADKYNRTFKLFTLKPELIKNDLQVHVATYNPFSTGTYTEWKNRLQSLFLESTTKGQQHYEILESNVMNIILQVIFYSNVPIDLFLLYEYISDKKLLTLLANKTQSPILIKQVTAIDSECLSDIAITVQLLVTSSFGHLFKTENSEQVIKIQESIINNEIVLFLLDSSTYKKDTLNVAKMIISDINSAFATIIDKIGCAKKTYCIFDEFAAYPANNLSDTITLHRSNGMHAIIGTQSLTTVGLASPDSQRIAEELIACCGTYLILQLQHDQDIERAATILGTEEDIEVTHQIDASDSDAATGMGSVKQVSKFIVHPQEIRTLLGRDLTAYLYRKSLGLSAKKIIVNRLS